MNNQTIKKDPDNEGQDSIEERLRSIWLGRKYVDGTFLGEEDLDEIDIHQLKDIMNSYGEKIQPNYTGRVHLGV